jgi:hypothetical protein
MQSKEKDLAADIAVRTADWQRELTSSQDRNQTVAGQTAAATRAEGLRTQIVTLEQQRSALAAQMASSYPNALALPSKGFINDLLTDDSGYSLHRVQMAGWTLVLLIVFAHGVYLTLSMPEFDSTLLGLMGISAGTYLGFKLPEKQTPPPPAVLAANQVPALPPAAQGTQGARTPPTPG